MLIFRKPYLLCYYPMPFYFSLHVIKITLTTLDSTFLNATLPRLSNPLYIRLLFFVICQFFGDCFHLYQAKGTCLYYSSINCSDTFLLTFKHCLFVFALLNIYLASLFLHICCVKIFIRCRQILF